MHLYTLMRLECHTVVISELWYFWGGFYLFLFFYIFVGAKFKVPYNILVKGVI